ncbi:cell division protein FtsQ/DivIB [Ligilactobacillus ceti]|uniref:Cell division protein DivIB n=1 Tax=Ligilactobacillus ceti DSM 22408 TaxID=1122146 RepID=A0A0R2KI24_9LACO|nr:cell division protein FtsQ/DivIB [Ligilactobacillus ceti]KRN88959.1 cell division protein [Ligilactobacillus ceti DSM 22408]
MFFFTNDKAKQAQKRAAKLQKAQLKRQKKLEKKERQAFFKNRLPKTNQQHQKRLRRKTVSLLVVFTIITISSLIFILPSTRLTAVRVKNCDYQTRKLVIKASNLTYYESLIGVHFRNNKIEQTIQNDVNSVKSAKINYSGNHITIDIKEHPVVGYAEHNKKFYKIMTTGKLANYALDNVNSHYPIFYNFYKKPQKLRMMVKEYQKLSPGLQQAISEVHYEPSKIDHEKIKLYMNDGNEVIAKISTFASKMKYYPKIISEMKQKGIVDLQVGAYSYPYPKKDEKEPKKVKKTPTKSENNS